MSGPAVNVDGVRRGRAGAPEEVAADGVYERVVNVGAGSVTRPRLSSVIYDANMFTIAYNSAIVTYL
jgi:hypothetical protein